MFWRFQGLLAASGVGRGTENPKILLWRTKHEEARLLVVDEGRKRLILIAACILAARKLSQLDGRNSPASKRAISAAIALAERIIAKIDSHWPVR